MGEWVLDKLEKNETFKGFTDIKFTPILTTNLGEALLEIYHKNFNGILNVASPDVCTKYEFAKKIAEVFGKNSNLVTPASSDEFNFKAKRAKDMYLNCDKAQRLLKTKLLNVEDGLKEFKNLREDGFLERLKNI